jgi:hypothetical protein
MEQPPGKLDEDAIREKAYELWIERGCPTDSAEQDWLEAERLLTGQAETAAAVPAKASPEPTQRSSAPPAGKTARRSSNG